MPSVIFLFPQNEESDVLGRLGDSLCRVIGCGRYQAGSQRYGHSERERAAVFHDLCMCSSSFASLYGSV
jgi:hypothetical protein